MTETQLKAFRVTLENKYAELERASETRDALAIETSPDELDRIQHASNRDHAISSLERNATRRREVHAALRRIHSGSFGICAGCGASINQRRLAAVPWAATCVVCQQTEEREQKADQGEFDLSLFEPA